VFENNQNAIGDSRRQSITATVPAELQPAEELLQRYALWASDRGGRRHTCGSAEREYRAPARADDDARRQPTEVAMKLDEAMACQHALARVPEPERVILVLLYVAQRPPFMLLRRLRIPPSLCQVRHLAGLRAFAHEAAALVAARVR
jgi:DNA-directed RNA polymerase specialized sigma24 family protein